MSAVEISDFALLQVAPWRGETAPLAAALQTAGWQLPALGEAWFGPQRMSIAVRPQRWLLLDFGSTAHHGAADGRLRDTLAPVIGEAGALVELSAARRAWSWPGEDARGKLAAGCRLDLHPQSFPVGRAAATLIAQVNVILVARADDWLLLAPSSTAVHFSEWLQRVG